MMTEKKQKNIRKKTSLAIAFLLCWTGLAAQTTFWKHRDWEGRISSKGTLEQLIFKGNRHNDTIPFFLKESNAGPAFYANMGNGDLRSAWIPDGHRSFRASIEGVECRLTYKEW